MIESKIFVQYLPIKALHLHPRHYTCLIEVEHDLFCYDCFASIELWSFKIQGELMLAFSLDFNTVYALQGKQITKVSKGVQNKICETTVENPDYFILNEQYYIFIKDDEIILQKRDTNQITSTKLSTKYNRILMLEQSTALEELSWIAISKQKIELLRVNLVLLSATIISEYSVEVGDIKLCKQDQVYKKICVIVDEEITILDYKEGTLKFLSKAHYDRVIRDVAFFTFAENTDSVGGKYKVQHLLILADEGEVVDLLELETGVIKGTFKLSSPVSHIYFNRLFNNSFITLSPTGEVSRVNMFGYDKEWVCLGFRFVEIENNEVYEQKEDDFQFTSYRKKKTISMEDLDDSSLSIFSPQQMLQMKVKRIGFEI